MSSSGIGNGIGGISPNNPPLTEVCPWSIDRPETIVVGDSVSSDGRFVLYTLASQLLLPTQPLHLQGAGKSEGGRRVHDERKLLWWNCSSITEEQVAIGLKKMGCNDQQLSRYIRRQPHQQQPGPDSTTITIRSIPAMISQSLSEQQGDFDEEIFVKQKIYQYIRKWLESTASDEQVGERKIPWIVIEDVTALSNLVGDRLVYALIHSLRSISSEQYSFGLILRCSMDHDQALAKLSDQPNYNSVYANWIGAGGRFRVIDDNDVPWERSLVELADVIVDVVPLATGYSREAHGRLIFTTRFDATAAIYNYCLTDTKVLTIRIK